MRECSLDFEGAREGARLPPRLAVEVPLCPPRRRAAGILAGLSLKSAGDMGRSDAEPRPFLPERAEFLRSAGLEGYRVYACRQVHSQAVLAVGGQSPEELDRLQADGLVTDRPGVLLTATVADCLPIYLADPRRGVIGLLHSGFRGTGIVEQAVTLLEQAYGCAPRDLWVTIGPGIGSCCYRVDGERAALFRSRFGECAVRRQGEHPHLDLRAANLALLARLGVRRVTVVRDCTACAPQLASFRRDGAPFVRMLAFIGVAGA